MAADFPATVPPLTTAIKDPVVSPADWLAICENLYEGVMATLGPNPHVDGGTGASYAHVRARLDALSASLLAFAAGNNQPPAGLRILNNATTPNSKVDVSLDSIGVQGYAVGAVSGTIDMTVSGLGGFDNLSGDPEDASQWYYIWIGYNPTTGTPGFCFSKSTTRAGLILSHASFSGYTAWRRVGSIFNNGSSNFLKIRQIGTTVFYDADNDTLIADTDYGFRYTINNDTVPHTVALLGVPPIANSAVVNLLPISVTSLLQMQFRMTGGANWCHVSWMSSAQQVVNEIELFVNNSAQFDLRLKNSGFIQFMITTRSYADDRI